MSHEYNIIAVVTHVLFAQMLRRTASVLFVEKMLDLLVLCLEVCENPEGVSQASVACVLELIGLLYPE